MASLFDLGAWLGRSRSDGLQKLSLLWHRSAAALPRADKSAARRFPPGSRPCPSNRSHRGSDASRGRSRPSQGQTFPAAGSDVSADFVQPPDIVEPIERSGANDQRPWIATATKM